MRPHHHQSVQPEADMTPMIDVVFQLIAFFMVIMNFEATQADERVKLPTSDLAKSTKIKPDQELIPNVGFERDKTGKIVHPEPVVFYAGMKNSALPK